MHDCLPIYIFAYINEILFCIVPTFCPSNAVNLQFGMRSAEEAAFTMSSQFLCEAIANIANTIWFAQKLVENGFITPQASSDIVRTPGYSDTEKCFRLLDAVGTQLKANAALFHTLVDILKSEAALMWVADFITRSYGRQKP